MAKKYLDDTGLGHFWDKTAYKNGIEYIVGTQSASTNAWTGVTLDKNCASSAIPTGKVIVYHLPYAGTSSAATLNLTFPDGTTSGAKNVYRLAGSTIGTNFGAGCDLFLVFNGTEWKVSAYQDTDSNNYDRMRHYTAVKAASAVTAGQIIVGTDAGYKPVANGVTFSINYPILYAGSAISAAATNNNTYDAYPGVNLQNTKSGYTGTTYKMTFLVGTLSGTTFTVNSDIFTQTIPSSADSKVYAPIGLMTDSNKTVFFFPTNNYWEYRNGAFRPISTCPTLATVATSGSYNDLSNKPTIPTVNNATLTIQKNGTTVKTFTANASSNVTANITVPTKTSEITNDSNFVASGDLATVATSGSYNDLSNKPTIPTVNNATLTIQKNGTTVKTFTANASSNVTANITVPTKTSDITNDSNFVASGDLATVATSGSYNDLSNKPTIPAAQVQSNWTQTTTTAVDYIKNKPTLATVATSGSYNDLSNKPTIPTVNNATLTIQKNGSTVKTFTANASSNVTANITVPTKTSDITNNGADNTSTYIETDDAQIMAAGQGNVIPCFDGMTPIKTFTWTVADTTYRPVYQFDNTGWTRDNLNKTVAYRITVTGSNIKQVVDINEQWFDPLTWPVTSVICRTLSADAATTGFRYLRAVYPISAGLNNNTYKFGSEIAAYNATSRTVTVEVFKTADGITWNETKPSGSIYTSSDYQATNSIQPYSTRGWMFRAPASFAASTASRADCIQSYEGSTTGSSVIKSGGAVTNGHLAYLADDGLVYDISNTTKNMVADESGIVGMITYTYAANKALDYRYFRRLHNMTSTQVGYISHGTLALGTRVYLRCTRDSSGNIHSDNYLATSMAAGYTWLPFGVATATNTIYMDVRRPTFYTLDSSGKISHINGKAVAGTTYTAGAHINITGSTIKAVDYVHSESPVSTSSVTPIITNGMISDDTITFSKTATGEFLKLQTTTTDPGAGSPLAANTLLGVYEA